MRACRYSSGGTAPDAQPTSPSRRNSMVYMAPSTPHIAQRSTSYYTEAAPPVHMDHVPTVVRQPHLQCTQSIIHSSQPICSPYAQHNSQPGALAVAQPNQLLPFKSNNPNGIELRPVSKGFPFGYEGRHSNQKFGHPIPVASPIGLCKPNSTHQSCTPRTPASKQVPVGVAKNLDPGVAMSWSTPIGDRSSNLVLKQYKPWNR